MNYTLIFLYNLFPMLIIHNSDTKKLSDKGIYKNIGLKEIFLCVVSSF